jgi:hypothetical protein
MPCARGTILMVRTKYTCAHCNYVRYHGAESIRIDLAAMLQGDIVSEIWCDGCLVDYGKRPIKIKGKRHPVLTIQRQGWK